MSKWGWWDIQFSTWCVVELGWGVETSSLFMGLLAGIFAALVPLGGWLCDQEWFPSRSLVTAVTLSILCVVLITMGPWQLSLPLETRRAIMLPYIIVEGVLCPLLEPIFLPQMLDIAQGRKSGDTSPLLVDEHLTNVVTSCFQFSFNLGQVIGPFLGAYFVQEVGFRGALIRWGGAFGVLGVGLGVRFCAGRAGSSGGGGTVAPEYAALATDDEKDEGERRR